MNKTTSREIFKRFAEKNPAPTTELQFHSTFELLIAAMLSAQATDVSVNKVTAQLFKVANTPRGILALGEEGLKNYIKRIGLFNSKAKNILKTCQILQTRHNNMVPDSLEALQALPGVGRKTANVILNTAFKHPTIAVDTHVFRVANRIGLARGQTPLAVELQLEKIIEKEYLYDAHHWLILHGRYICKARTPLCNACFINDLCEYPNKNL